MEGYGGREERSEPVRMTCRREREPSEAKEGSGWPLREAGEVHCELMCRRGCCRRCKPRGLTWGVSGVFVGVVYAQRKGEKERDKDRVLARARPCIGQAGRLRARAAGGEREGETRGAARWRVADVEAPRLA